MPAQVWAILVVAAMVAVLTSIGAMLGLRRPSVLVGCIVGVLLGPTVAGRFVTSWEWYESTFQGGRAERLAYEQLEKDHDSQLRGLAESDVSPQAIREREEELRVPREESAARITAAQTSHQTKLNAYIWVLAGLVAGWMIPRSESTQPHPSRVSVVNKSPTFPAFRQESLFVGLWSILFTLGIVGLAVKFVFNGTIQESIGFGLAFCVLGRPLHRLLNVMSESADESKIEKKIKKNTSGEPENASTGNPPHFDDSEHGDQPAVNILPTWKIAVVGWWAGVGTILYALMSLSNDDYLLAALFAGGIVVSAVVRSPTASMSPLWGMAIIRRVIVPTLVALPLLRFDVLECSPFWVILFGLIIGGDSRWLACASGLRLIGSSSSASWRSATPLADVGALQAAVAIAFYQVNWINETYLCAALLGALATDLTMRVRWKYIRVVESHQMVKEGSESDR
jgi:hypothetical protein